MKRNIILSVTFLLFLSCRDYNEKQENIIRTIASKSNKAYNENFIKNTVNEFSKQQIIELSSNQNPKVALYFFQILAEKFPEECFSVLMKNLDNRKTLDVSTSYDTINEMTVPDAMMFYTISKKDLFTNQQKEKLFSTILNDIENKDHLEGYLISYLDEHQATPDPKYYNKIKNIILKRADNKFYYNLVLLNYFSNYNKPEDIIIIENFLKRNIFEDGPIHMNGTVEYINKHPKDIYFPILEEFYSLKIKGKTFRADDIFFELEELTKATINYKTENAKQLMKNITYNTKYISNGNFAASNEQIYLLLKNNDKSNYFADIKNDLQSKVNKAKLDTIVNWNNRWSH